MSAPASTVSSAVAMSLETADGVRLAAAHRAPADGRSPADPGAYGVVLAPGFSGWTGKAAVHRLAEALAQCARSAGILLVDLRGHGRSAGVSTLGDREVLDVDAAVAAARRLGYRTIVSFGWSMGASCVLRHAALTGEQVHGHPVREHPDAVATVSAVSRWEVRDSVSMRRLHRMIETRLGRQVARRLLKVRIDPAGGWALQPMSPVESAARLTVPLLVVHGDRDSYFGTEHAVALVAAAGPTARLWLVRGLGHAEEAAVRPDVPGLVERLAGALGDLAAGRPVPEWDQSHGGQAGAAAELP